MADVNVKQPYSFVATPTLKSSAEDQKVCEKKNLSLLFGVDRKFRHSGSLFGIARHSLMMPDSHPWTDFLSTSHTHERFLYSSK